MLSFLSARSEEKGPRIQCRLVPNDSLLKGRRGPDVGAWRSPPSRVDRLGEVWADAACRHRCVDRDRGGSRGSFLAPVTGLKSML